MSCANSVLPVFMAESSLPDRRGEPQRDQIRLSNDLPKPLMCQRLLRNPGSANRTLVKVYPPAPDLSACPRPTRALRGVRGQEDTVPWARPDSGFPLRFGALLMSLVAVVPVNTVARLVGEHD